MRRFKNKYENIDEHIIALFRRWKIVSTRRTDLSTPSLRFFINTVLSPISFGIKIKVQRRIQFLINDFLMHNFF